MNRPITIDGTPVITSDRKRTSRASGLLPPVLVEVDAAEDPERDRHQRRGAGDQERPGDRRAHPGPREPFGERRRLGEEVPAEDLGASFDHVTDDEHERDQRDQEREHDQQRRRLCSRIGGRANRDEA